MWIVPKEFRVKIGGNYYINTPNIILAKGESIFRLKRREEDGLLAIDFDIYDATGEKIATIRNGNIVQGDATNYDLKKEYHRYWITEKETGRIICDIKKRGKSEDGSELEVSVDLFTKSGFHIQADPDGTSLNSRVQMSGNVIANCPAAVVVE